LKSQRQPAARRMQLSLTRQIGSVIGRPKLSIQTIRFLIGVNVEFWAFLRRSS
jgi:hypothetical protein